MTELGLIMGIGVLGLVVAGLLARGVLAMETGTAEMGRVSDAIKQGAEAFLRRQNRTIGLLSLALASVIALVYGLLRRPQSFDVASRSEMAVWMTLSFVLGALCSGAAGYAGMWVAIRANLRTAAGARTSVNAALQAALRGGAVAGLFVTALSLLGVGGLFGLVFVAKHGLNADPALLQRIVPQIPLLIAGYGFGASFVALFAQVGGGIYTKAADVGADLVGKVEAGIPEDDARNPAVVADLVGDNVGDCAGRGADLFESISAENIGAMILAASLYEANPGRLSNVVGVLLFPLVVNAFGILASVVGVLVVKTDDSEDPMSALNRGFYVTAVLAAAAVAGTCVWLLGPYWKMFFLCGLVGIATSLAFVFITLHYTEHKHRPVREIAEASVSGPATNVIQGMALGLESTALPVVVVSAAILISYKLGEASGLDDAGLFGTAVAVLGMLSTAGYILAMDTFGPITDNAGGIVEMSLGEENPEARRRTDLLDAAGNTTKALTKGYAVGSAALAAFLLFSAVVDEINNYARAQGLALKSVNLNKPAVFVAAMLGAMLVFWFASMCIQAVGRTAQEVIAEVRRQFAGLERGEDGKVIFPAEYAPDYRACVDLVTRAALRQMVKPGLLAVGMPIAVGMAMKALRTELDPLLGAEAVMAFLMVGTIVGVLLALVLNNSGGAWDNAKKYIESGAHGGKYLEVDGVKTRNPTHAAAVVGDTVGDPFKDTAGPSLHVLIKLLATVTLVLVPLFL